MESILITDKEGTKHWKIQLGKYHNEHGPAYENKAGYKAWWIYGKRHRIDGPAIEYQGEQVEWYLNNKKLTEQEWKQEVRKLKLDKILK